MLVGRCSQDDGAPPLWPWAQVLERLGEGLPTSRRATSEDAGAQFRSRERLVRTVRDAARERTRLVVLDDLHWADVATLRVLRLLAETATDERLLVLATWREHPEPTGALAEVAEALARRHAVRRELVGLPSADVAEVFEKVAHNRPSEEQAAPCASAPTATRSTSWSTPGSPASAATWPAWWPRPTRRPGCRRCSPAASSGCPATR